MSAAHQPAVSRATTSIATATNKRVLGMRLSSLRSLCPRSHLSSCKSHHLRTLVLPCSACVSPHRCSANRGTLKDGACPDQSRPFAIFAIVLGCKSSLIFFPLPAGVFRLEKGKMTALCQFFTRHRRR